MRHRTVPLTFGFLVATAASGCSSSKEDPEFEAPAALLGHWQERSVDGVVLAEHDYADDGSVHIINNIGGVRNGMWTYAAEQEALTLEYAGPGQPTTETSTYVVDGDIFMQWAFLPEGPIDGPIGTWRSSLRSSSGPFGTVSGGVDSYDEVLTVNADGAATYVQALDTEYGYAFDGRWSIENSRFKIEREGLNGLPSETLELRYAPGAVIGHHLFERSAR